MTSHLIVLLISSLHLICCFVSSKPLAFNKDGTFRIMQIADLHYGESSDKDEASDRVQRTLIQEEQPDFIVFSGDQVSGWVGGSSTGWYQEQYEKLIKPVHDSKIPYGIILGNHDDEADLNRSEIVQLDIDSGANFSSHTRQGPQHITTGASNYYIDIMESETSNSTAARIWMLDSMDKGCNGVATSWGCVETDTVEWMKSTALKLPRVPSIAYIHIPISEFIDVWNNGPTNGTKDESVACPSVITGIVDAAILANIQAIWSGHNHNNDYHGFSDDSKVLKLGYARKTGYGSYGPSLDRQRGAVVVQLERGKQHHIGDAAVWIRQEDGSRVDICPSKTPKSQTKQTTCPAAGTQGLIRLPSDLTPQQQEQLLHLHNSGYTMATVGSPNRHSTTLF